MDILENCTIVDADTEIITTQLSTCPDWLNIVENTSYMQIFSRFKPVFNYVDTYNSLSQCKGQILIHQRQEMKRDIKSMLPTLEFKSRRRYKYYDVEDNLIPNGHIIVAHTHAGRRVIDSFTRFVESGLLNEWEKVKKWVSLGLKSFNPKVDGEPIEVVRKKEVMMIIVCMSCFLTIGLAGLLGEIAVDSVNRAVISVCFHKICRWFRICNLYKRWIKK